MIPNLKIFSVFISQIVFVLSVSAKVAKEKKYVVPPRPTSAATTDLESLHRLDPHGSPAVTLSPTKILESKACEVCHVGGDLHPPATEVKESCLNCHNRFPHSGVAEHTKKDLSCISCHAVHRADAIPWNEARGRFLNFREKSLSPGEALKPSSHPMLRKTCTDCHKW